jgi:RNA polymerase sigma factor (sigma-70 family)
LSPREPHAAERGAKVANREDAMSSTIMLSHEASSGSGVADPISEREIDIAAFRAGHEAAIQKVYVAHAATLQSDTRRRTGPAEAEAVVHDVFLELLQNPQLRAQFTGGHLLAWLRRIARLKALEHLRRTRRPTPIELAEAVISNEADLEAREVVARFLAAGVPEEQKPFFGMRLLNGQTQVEIATHLGIPRSTLEGWEHRLIEKLRAFVLDSSL